MKEITAEILADFVGRNKIELSATQSKLCVPVINRIYKKMSAGICFAPIKVAGSLICDGHHRYIASVLAKFPLERMEGLTTSATELFHWESVAFEREDWDTEAKIEMLNREDAAFNRLTLEGIKALLKQSRKFDSHVCLPGYRRSYGSRQRLESTRVFSGWFSGF